MTVDRLKNENLQYVEKNEELAMDYDALKNILLEGEISEQVKERLQKLGITGGTKEVNARSATMIGRAIKSLNEDINESDVLDKQLQKQSMAILENLIAGKATLGPNETKALICLRKEFYRRDMEIQS